MDTPISAVRHEAMRIGGERVIEVRFPFTGQGGGTIPQGHRRRRD